MEKINLIEFNGNAVEAISYNGVDLDTLIYNNSYQWDKQSLEPMYLIGMSTGESSIERNVLFDINYGLFEGPASESQLKNNTSKFASSGPNVMIIKTKTERPMRLEKLDDKGTLDALDDVYNDIEFNSSASIFTRHYIEEYGYIIFNKATHWVGGEGGVSYERLTLNEDTSKANTEYQKDRRVYRLCKLVDENNNWFFEGEYTTKLVKHGIGQSSGSVIINFYPGYFSHIGEIPNINFHDYAHGQTYKVDATNTIESLTNGMITNIEIVKQDYTTFQLNYTLSQNTTGKYRDCSIVLSDPEGDESGYTTELIQLFIIQEPDVSDRAYFADETSSTDEEIYTLGNVKNIKVGDQISLSGSVTIAVPNTMSIISTSEDITIPQSTIITIEGRQYKRYTIFAYNKSYTIQITQ